MGQNSKYVASANVSLITFVGCSGPVDGGDIGDVAEIVDTPDGDDSHIGDVSEIVDTPDGDDSLAPSSPTPDIRLRRDLVFPLMLFLIPLKEVIARTDFETFTSSNDTTVWEFIWVTATLSTRS